MEPNEKVIKRAIIGVAAFILVVFFAGCGCTRVAPTEVGFRINNSGDYRGLDTLPVVTGYQFIMPFVQSIVKLPTTQQHVEWETIPISCLGGAGFNMDVGLNYRVNPFLASKIYLKYKTGDLESITQTYIKNIVRSTMQNISGTMTVDSMLNHLPQYERTVADSLTVKLAPQGFIVDLFNNMKRPLPTDENLSKSINAKIQAKQDAETSVMQLQQSIAEANKKIAIARGDSASKVIIALADAEVIKVKTQSLSTNPQYIDLIKAEKWDGALPTYVGNGGGTLFNIK